MKRFMIASIGLLMFGTLAQAATFETNGGIGAVVPDNENVESSVIGKVDGQFNLNDYLAFGLSVSQTGNFKQESKPSEVVYANENPQAFGVTTFHPVHDDTLIVNNNTTDITNIQVFNAPDKLPNRPQDLTERSMWAAESYLQVGVPIWKVRPFVRLSLGAAGVRTVNGDTLIGSSKGLGGGISTNLKGIIVSVEAMRRYVDAGKATFGNWNYFAKAGISF